MRPYLVKTPRLVQRFFHNYAWRIKTSKKEIYLTFDDGPVPDFTPWVLETLKKFEAKATFFCVGENIQKHPEIYQRVIQDQHSVGNHTFNHLQGWKTSTSKYIKNILKAESYLQEARGDNGIKLFRPPHGRIKPNQARALRKKGYKIIMWDVLSADFDRTISKEQCLQNVLQNAGQGSIVVFHDSLKASEKLQYVLPKVLEYFKEKGFSFEKLD